MSQAAYDAFCRDVAQNFAKHRDVAELGATYKFLDHIPDSAWPAMASAAVRSWDKWPANLVKSVNDLYWQTIPQASRPVRYDPVEDYRFPVTLMHVAYGILDVKGPESFTDYCDSVHMPKNDRERVRYKLTIVRRHQG